MDKKDTTGPEVKTDQNPSTTSAPGATPGAPVASASQEQKTPESPATTPVSPTPGQNPPTPPPTTPTAGTPTPTPPPAKKGNPMGMILFVIVLLIAAAGFAYWFMQTKGQQQKSPVAQAAVTPSVTNRALVIGTDATYPPMEEQEKDGTFVGYDIDLGNLIAKGLGTKAEFKHIKFDDIFTGLDKMQYDVIISSITITEERKKKYDFSDQYLNAGQVLVMRKEAGSDSATLKTAADVKGKKVGVEQGTINVAEAMKLTSPDLVVQYPSNDPAIDDLKSGKIEALITDLPNAKGVITENTMLRIASDPLTNDYYGVVFRKGDPREKKINEIISSLRVKGILTDLKKKWLD